MDDEAAPSDFRFYDNIEASFREHSDFLTNNIRYRLLFDIPVTDYRNWAYGLKQYGYATDSVYAVKLIRLIEEHGLYLYDDAKPGQQFQILDTQPDVQIVEVQPDWELQSFRPDKFTILSSVQFGPERLEMVMEAPAYDLGDYFRIQPANLATPDQEADFTSVPGEKIRPIYPLPADAGSTLVRSR